MSDQRVVVVTGGSRGIGRGVALELGRRGCSVVVNYARNVRAAGEVVAAIEQAGSQALAVQADVAVADDRRRLIEQALDRFGRLDVLVNNAGITSPGRKDILEASEESWEKVFATNLSMMVKLFAQRLAEHGIRVYEISPGVIESDMTAPVKEKYDRLIAEGLWPIRRWGKPEDVAKAVAAVVEDYFPFTTGSRFDVDGGFHIRTL